MRYHHSVTAILLIGLWASPLRADPLQVRSGAMTTTDASAVLDLEGDGGLGAHMVGWFLDNNFAPYLMCNPFCSSISGSGVFSSLDITGTVSADSATYFLSSVGALGTFTFTTAMVPLPLNDGGTLTMELPFTLDGHFTPVGGSSVSFIGAGTAAISFTTFVMGNFPPGWQFTSARYDFVDPAVTATAVPEPASWLLLASGVVGLHRRKGR